MYFGKLKLKTAPASEPVDVGELKDHMRVTDTKQDSVIESYGKAAREAVESYTGRSLVEQTWTASYDTFPPYCADLELERPPLKSVTSVKYFDENGVEQTLVENTDFYVDAVSTPGKLVLCSGSWPVVQSGRPNAVTVEFVCGYDEIPEAIRHAIKFLTAHFFENREPVNIGNTPSNIPMTVEYLLDPYRVINP